MLICDWFSIQRLIFTPKLYSSIISNGRGRGGGGGEGNDTKILQMLMSCMNYMLKRLSKLCKQDPGLRGCVLATSGILIVHLCIYNVFTYLLKFIVNYEDFEPNMFQQHHKIEYHCFV